MANMPIIATVRGTPEQRELLKEYAAKAGVILNAFMLESALEMIRCYATDEKTS